MKKEYASFILQPASEQQDETKVTLVLNKELTIFSIETAKDEFRSVLEGFKYITLSLNKVENIDLSFLQLIYAFMKAAKAKGLEVNIEGQLPEEQQGLIANSGLTKIIESN